MIVKVWKWFWRPWRPFQYVIYSRCPLRDRYVLKPDTFYWRLRIAIKEDMLTIAVIAILPISRIATHMERQKEGEMFPCSSHIAPRISEDRIFLLPNLSVNTGIYIDKRARRFLDAIKIHTYQKNLEGEFKLTALSTWQGGKGTGMNYHYTADFYQECYFEKGELKLDETTQY